MKHEFHCPVCGKENDTLQCESCGFDGSRDYERLLTLSRIPVDIKSIAGWKKHRENRLRCKGCGCSTFYVDLNTNRCVCSDCGMEVEPEDGMFVRRQDSAAPKHQRSLAQGEASRYRSDIQYRRRVLKENWGLILGEALFYIFLLKYLIAPYLIEGWTLIKWATPNYVVHIDKVIAGLANFCDARPGYGRGEYNAVFGHIYMGYAANKSPVVGVNMIAIGVAAAAIGGVYLLVRAIKVLCAMRQKSLHCPDFLGARIVSLVLGLSSFIARSIYLPDHIYSNTSESRMVFHYLSVGLVMLIPMAAIVVYQHRIREYTDGDSRSIFTIKALLNEIYDPRHMAQQVYRPAMYVGGFLCAILVVPDYRFSGVIKIAAVTAVVWVVSTVIYLTQKKENRWAVILGILVGLVFCINVLCIELGDIFSLQRISEDTAFVLLVIIGTLVIDASILRRMGWMCRETMPERITSPAIKWLRGHKHMVFYIMGVLNMLAYTHTWMGRLMRVYTVIIQLVTPVLYELAVRKGYRSKWRKTASVGVAIELMVYFLAVCDTFGGISGGITNILHRLVMGGIDLYGISSAVSFVLLALKSISIAFGLKRMKTEHHDSTRLRR